MCGCGRDAFSDVCDSAEVSPGCPGVVGGLYRCLRVDSRPSLMSGGGRGALSDVRKWSEGPPGSPEVVRKPSWMSGSSWEAL